MMYLHSSRPRPLVDALCRAVESLLTTDNRSGSRRSDQIIELVPMAPAAELQARAEAEKPAADEFRRRRHALRMRGG